MKLYLELFYSRIIDQKVLYLKKQLDITGEVDDPDKVVNRILRGEHAPGMIDSTGLLIHSTSWRYEAGGNLVITYLVYSEELNMNGPEIKTIELSNLRLANNAQAKTPRPPVIEEDHVIAHGIRHLGFLAKNDPVIKRQLSANPMTLSALTGVPAALAGNP